MRDTLWTDVMEEKIYYRIKDVVEFTGENASTLRYWEAEFNELSPKRGAKGTRLYTSKDIETVKIIQFLLRTKGMHLTAAKEQMARNHKNISKKVSALEELVKVKEELELLLKSLSKSAFDKSIS